MLHQFGCAITKNRKRVVIIDADFGLANIEVILGIVPKYIFSDVMNGEKLYRHYDRRSMNIKFISEALSTGFDPLE